MLALRTLNEKTTALSSESFRRETMRKRGHMKNDNTVFVKVGMLGTN